MKKLSALILLIMASTTIAEGSETIPEVREGGRSWGEIFWIAALCAITHYFLFLAYRAYRRQREKRLFEEAYRNTKR